MNEKIKEGLYKSIAPILTVVVFMFSIPVVYKLTSPYERCVNDEISSIKKRGGDPLVDNIHIMFEHRHGL